MKKRFLLLIAVLLLCVCAVTLSACKDKNQTGNGNETEACEHQWGDWSVKTAATCVAEGTEQRTCGKCGATENRSVTKAAHQYGTEWIGNENGHHHKCLNCDAVTVDEAHRPGPEATSTTSQVCLDCNYILNHAIAHKLVKKDAVAPTCLTAGNVEYWHCEDCGANFSDAEGKTLLNNPSLAALGHTWDKEDPGCEDDLTCTVCSAVQIAKGHQYSIIGSTKLTCTENATLTYSCSECGHSYTDIVEKALGHQLGEYVAVGEPTKIGESCEYLQAYHADCANEGCVGADKTATLTMHHYGAAKETTFATCKTAGIKTYTCTVCGATRTEKYEDATAHSWGNGKASGGKTVYTCTVAGCNKTKTVYDSDTAEVANGDLSDEIALKNASLSLDETVKNKLGQNTTFTAEKLKLADVIGELGEGAGYLKDDALVFNFGISSDGSAVTFDGGKVTVRIPYMLTEDDDPDNIAVFYIDSNGTLKFYTAKYVNGYAVFEADHFSTYTVTRLTPAERCALYGHSERDVVVAPTCEEEGYTISICLRCHNTRKHSVLPATGHNWNLVSATGETVDCTHSRTVVYKCLTCDEEKNEYTPALGHNWTESDRKDASCTAAGSVTKTCGNCRISYVETIPQKAHDYRSEITPVTCTTDGYTTNTCTVCGDVLKNNFVIAQGHNFKETVVAPTCTEGGYTLMECRACDYSCRINEMPAAHTWDRAAADCGHAQVCMVCGKVGTPATGNHQMKDGVCSVCGEGCAHEFVTSTIAPTCEERGYTLEKCGKCGLEKKSNYTDALGHTGVASCEKCGKGLLSDEYLGRLLADNRMQKFNLRLNSFVITAPYRYRADVETTDMSIIVHFAELVLSFDENGRLTGNAYGQMVMVRGIDHPTLQFRAALRDGTLYFSYEGQPDEFGDYPAREFLDKMTSAYGKLSLEDLLQQMAETSEASATAGMLLTVFGQIPTMVKALRELPAGNTDFAAIGKAARRALLGFFDVTRDGEDFVFTFSFEKLRNFLLSETVSDMADYLFGEGALEKLEAKIFEIGDSTVAQLIKKCNDQGLDEKALYNKLNETIATLTGGAFETVEDVLRAAGINLGTKEDGTPLTVIDLLNQLIADKKTLFEMAVEKINESSDQGQITVKDLKDAVSSALAEYGAANPIELILGLMNPGDSDPSEPNPPDSGEDEILSDPVINEDDDSKKPGAVSAEAIAENIRKYLGLLGKDLHVSIIAGKDAKIKSLEISLDMDVSEYSSENKGSISFSFSLPTEYAAKLDINAFIDETTKKTENVRLNRKTLSKFLNDSRYTLEFDENGNCIGVSFRGELSPASIGEWVQFSNIYIIGSGKDANGTPYLLRVYAQYTYVFNSTELSVLLTEDCGDFAMANLLCLGVRSYGVYKYYGENVAPVPYDGEYNEKYEEEMTTRTEQTSLILMVNTKTGKVQSIIGGSYTGSDTMHLWELVKSVAAVGCEGVGEEHFVCSKCGKTYVRYFMNGHRATVTEGEFLTDKKVCTAGVKAITKCTECGKVLQEEIINEHYHYELARYDVSREALGEVGSLCGGEVRLWGCLCGEFRNVENYLSCDGMLHPSGYLKSGNIIFDDCEFTMCAVTNPKACNFVYGEYYDTFTDRCYRKTKMMYFYGAVYDGTNSEGYPVFRLTENSIVIDGGIRYMDHNPKSVSESTETITTPDGRSFEIPVKVCDSCGRYEGNYCEENENISYRITIDIQGIGQARSIDLSEYRAGGEYHFDENLDEDGELEYRRIDIVTYGTNGERCTGIRKEQYRNQSESESSFDACWLCDSIYEQNPTCTGRGSYYPVCANCHCTRELRIESPHGHQLGYNSEKDVYYCTVCGLESNGGMNGAILMEDLTDESSKFFSVGFYRRNEDYTFTPYLSLVAEDGTELTLTKYDYFLYFSSTYQDRVDIDPAQALEAAIKQYGTALNGKYQLKFTFVPDGDEKNLDYALTFDAVYVFENGVLK